MPQTSHTIAAYEAIVASASHLLSLVSPKLHQQPLMTSQSDAAIQHDSVAFDSKNYAVDSRDDVSELRLLLIYFWLVFHTILVFSAHYLPR